MEGADGDAPATVGSGIAVPDTARRLGWTKPAQTGQTRLIRGFTPTEKIVTACTVPGSDFHIPTWTLNQVGHCIAPWRAFGGRTTTSDTASGSGPEPGPGAGALVRVSAESPG